MSRMTTDIVPLHNQFFFKIQMSEVNRLDDRDPTYCWKELSVILLRLGIQSWLCFEIAVLRKSPSFPRLLNHLCSMSRMGMCLEWTRSLCVFKALCASVKFILHDTQFYEF